MGDRSASRPAQRQHNLSVAAASQPADTYVICMASSEAILMTLTVLILPALVGQELRARARAIILEM